MAFNRYYLYSDLMKQLSASQPSEMAVSLVTSNSPAISAPSPLKRPADISPLKHIMASGALDLHVQNPVKLLSESINNSLNGGSTNVLEPLAKKLRLEECNNKVANGEEAASLNNNAETAVTDKNTTSSSASRLTTQKQTTNLLPGNVAGSKVPYSCGWGLGSTSPIRSQEVSESSSPQPPTLKPITPPQSDNNRTPPPPSHHQHLLPNLEPSPLVIKPAMVANSPSRSSTDGEISLENTDPNGDPMEGHEVCPECQKVFKRKIYLQRHMEREHWSTAKVFKCEDCNYETKHQSNLSVHRRTHTGERPYHCGACGQRYTQGHLLKSHIRSRHGGNMEFYNLDKKSDSTRGRKSLDIKHDINIVHRQDKISTLLQAAAAANGTQNMQPPKSPFGNLLPTGMPAYLNALSPFYNMQNSRPLMASPLALGNPLSVAGSNFFTLRGMPSLPSSMLPTTNNKPSNNNSATFPSPTSVKAISPQKSGEKMAEDNSAKDVVSGLLMMKGQSLHSKMDAKGHMTSSPEAGLRETSNKMSMPVFMSQQQAISPQMDNPSAPEDLSVKPTTDTSSNHSNKSNNSNIEARRHSSSSQDLVISSSGVSSSMVGEADAEEEEQMKQGLEQHPTDLSCQSTEDHHHQQQQEEQHLSSGRRSSSISDEQPEEMMMEEMMQQEDQYHHLQDNEESDIETGSLFGGEARDTFSPKLMSSECCQDGCQHADQLTKLRKNVMRMLRCFAPEFSENNIDYSTKEVDQLLYDVMFSSVEELSRKK